MTMLEGWGARRRVATLGQPIVGVELARHGRVSTVTSVPVSQLKGETQSSVVTVPEQFAT